MLDSGNGLKSVSRERKLFSDQVHDKGNSHADAADANEALNELVALLALQETAEITADPGACRHDDGDRPVDFPVNSKGDGADQQEHVGERVLEGVDFDGRESGVAREPENLHEPDTHLHNAAVDGDGEKSEGTLEGELFRRVCRRLAQNVFAQVAHDHHKADDNSENGLEKLVSNVHQKACSDECTE